LAIAGDVLIIIGIVFMFFGIIGIFRFKGFFARILVSSKIDTVGAFTIIIGLAFKHGIGFFSLKLILLIVLMMIINPIITHITARSAWLSGYKIDEKYSGNNKDIT